MRISLRSAPTSVASNRALRKTLSGRLARVTGGEKQFAMLPHAADSARQVRPALTVPGSDQGRQGLDVAGGQRTGRAARRDGGQPEYPGPERVRQRSQPARLPGAVLAAQL